MHRALSVVTLLFLAVMSGGCRKPAKLVLTKDQRARIQENILSEAPTPKIPINANFADNIRLIGVDLSADRVRPGDTMTATYYWECLRETPGEWKVFVHLELPAGKRMILDHHPVGELYPIANWKKGEIIRDVQRFTVAADTKPGPATLWAGLFNEAIYREQGGGDRMEIKNKDQVPNDGDHRVRAARFTVTAGGEASAAESPVLVARRAKEPVRVDGTLDEAVWAAAGRSARLQAADGGEAPADLATTVLAAYDDATLYLAVSVRDPAIETPYKNRDDELWNGDAVEVFLDPGADGHDYLELQVSPANVVFDALFASHRTPDWTQAKAWNAAGLKTAVRVTGTLNQPGDGDTGYDVEIAIPFADLPGFGTAPPGASSTLRANFFRIEARDGKVVGAQAFSPAGGDFHDLSKASTIRFEAEAATAPTPISPAAVAPALKVQPARRLPAEALPAVKAGMPARAGALRTTRVPAAPAKGQ